MCVFCPGALRAGPLTMRQQISGPLAQSVKNLPAVQETWVQFLGQEDPLEKEMATHSSILAWRIPWTEEPGRLHGFTRVGCNLATKPPPGYGIIGIQCSYLPATLQFVSYFFQLTLCYLQRVTPLIHAPDPCTTQTERRVTKSCTKFLFFSRFFYFALHLWWYCYAVWHM